MLGGCSTRTIAIWSWMGRGTKQRHGGRLVVSVRVKEGTWSLLAVYWSSSLFSIRSVRERGPSIITTGYIYLKSQIIREDNLLLKVICILTVWSVKICEYSCFFFKWNNLKWRTNKKKRKKRATSSKLTIPVNKLHTQWPKMSRLFVLSGEVQVWNNNYG